MAWIFALWAQCGTGDDANAFIAHFEGLSWTLSDGTATHCEVSLLSNTCCWITPTNLSHSGVSNANDAAQLTEVGKRLYERLRSAPPFRFAMVGVEVDDVRTEIEVEEMIRASHSAYQGLVVSTDLWQRAGKPSAFRTFRPGHVWRPYMGETKPG
ncbi:hypothetical protein [Pendulispora albinea]|uniref:Uncharacterized protein n=1 Tax=Pendulispora albinea TaxID=2741071 RepID=A0ABZ2LLN5_9BACT